MDCIGQPLNQFFMDRFESSPVSSAVAMDKFLNEGIGSATEGQAAHSCLSTFEERPAAAAHLLQASKEPGCETHYDMELNMLELLLSQSTGEEGHANHVHTNCLVEGHEQPNTPKPVDQTAKPKCKTPVKRKRKYTSAGCPVCKKQFFRKYEMMRHLKATHLQLKPFSCNLCTSSFSRKTHLKLHLKKIHKLLVQSIDDPGENGFLGI